jgi:cell wall-associated NlpC family hydrolase
MFSIRVFIVLLFTVLTISCATKKQVTHNQKPSHAENKNTLKSEIESWMNVPYKYGGNDKQGVDCSGFVKAIYLSVYKINLPRTTKELFNKSSPIKKENLQEGDLVFFKITGNDVSHVGIYLKENQFVHASSSKGVVVNLLNNPYYESRFIRGGSIKK